MSLTKVTLGIFRNHKTIFGREERLFKTFLKGGLLDFVVKAHG